MSSTIAWVLCLLCSLATAEQLFWNCTLEQRQLLASVKEDAINIVSYAAAAFDIAVTEHDFGYEFDQDEGKQGIASQKSPHRFMIKKWFGSDALPPTAAGLRNENAEYIQAAFKRAHQLFLNDTFPFQCEGWSDENCAAGAAAYVDYGMDDAARTKWQKPGEEGLHFCPTWFGVATLTDFHTMLGNLEEMQPSAPNMMIHEIMHTMQVGQERAILDMCVPSWYDGDTKLKPGHPGSEGAYGVPASHFLAWQDTTLAMHNAENYAGFAIHAASWAEAGCFLDYSPFSKDRRMSPQKVEELKSVADKLDSYRSVTTPPPASATTSSTPVRYAPFDCEETVTMTPPAIPTKMVTVTGAPPADVTSVSSSN